ncbi:MAG: hypothetical protein RR894_18265 [Terrisporobacter sp.]
MLNNIVLLIVCIILVSLATILIVLFMKYIKTMNILTEELRKEQEVLYKEIKSNLDDKNQKKTEVKSNSQQTNKNNQRKIQVKSNNNKPNNKNTNLNTPTLKSSKVSQQELLELIKDKEQVFKKEVTIQSGGGFTDLDIDISKNKKIDN